MENVPQHVVLVPDGNRRWAKKRNLPSQMGHLEGVKAMERAIQTAYDFRIPYFTIWGCSTSNIDNRSEIEVKTLFTIFRENFDRIAKAKETHNNKVRIRVLGRWEERFSQNLKDSIENAIQLTKNYGDYNLTLLLYYTGLDEMVAAIRSICEAKTQDPNLEINKDTIKSHLWTKDLPPVDFVIRTGGEPHWSAGFLMWDVAEAQLYFTETLWPDFSKQEFARALDYYAKTERRHGK